MHIKNRVNKKRKYYAGPAGDKPKKKVTAYSFLKLILFLFLLLLFVRIMVFLGETVLQSKTFALKKVKITGLKYMNEDRINKIIDLNKQGLFNVDINSIRHNIELTFPQIYEVSVWREIPDKVMINITERVPIAFIDMPDGKVIAVDKNSVLFQPIDSFKFLDKPIITGLKLDNFVEGKRSQNGALLETVLILNVINNNSQYVKDKLDEINFKNMNDIRLYLNENNRLIIALINADNEKEKVAYLEKSFQLYLQGKVKIKKYIDVRFWNQQKKDVIVY